MERDQRTAAPAHATGAVEFVALEDLAPDETFRLRPDGDIALLATSVGRLGQLAPLELRPWLGTGTDGPRWQVVAGFRRLAAVRLLARERVLARLHGTLSDEDAWAVALSDALLREPLSADELASLRARLAAISLAPWADELVDEALVRAPVPAELRERFFEFLGAASSPSPSPSTSTTSIAPAPPEPSQSRDLSSTAPASSEPSQSRAPSSTALAPSEPSQSRAPTPGRDETRPGVRRDEPGQASTSVLTSTAPAPPEPSQSRAAAPGQGEPGQAFAEGEPAPGGVELVEVTADELVHDLVARLSQLNQDLAVAFEAWEDLPPEGRRAIVEQARYIAQLMPFMERE